MERMKVRKTIMFMTANKMRAMALCAILAVSAMVVAHPSGAQETLGRTEVEKIVRDYLIQNPQILLEMQQALEAKQQAAQAIAQKQTIADRKEEIYNSSYQIEIGDPQAKVTIVEFFDYNCGFCQRALGDMNRMIESGDSVRFVLKEFPVLGEASFEASKVSMAFSRVMPEKYAEFHIALLGMEGGKDGARAMQLAVEMGADEEAVKAEMENPAILETIREVYDIADGLGITGTPSYLIGDKVVFGAVGYDKLNDELQQLTR